MRARNVKDKKEILENSRLVINNPKEYKGKWKEVFKNNHPIHLEIGSGKCKFIKEKALKNPDINFIGVEKVDSILSIGVKNIKSEIENLRLINYDALLLDEIFEKEIECLYLNFSDPWPKERHTKRRLTNERFLNVYDSIFKNTKTIIQKTDNENLFKYSIISLSNYGYVIKTLSFDLQNEEKNDNIMTEYEEKFTNKGCKIFMLEATKK